MKKLILISILFSLISCGKPSELTYVENSPIENNISSTSVSNDSEVIDTLKKVRFSYKEDILTSDKVVFKFLKKKDKIYPGKYCIQLSNKLLVLERQDLKNSSVIFSTYYSFKNSWSKISGDPGEDVIYGATLNLSAEKHYFKSDTTIVANILIDESSKIKKVTLGDNYYYNE